MKKKILLVFGTRPEAIKMAPLVKEFQKDTINFDIKVCVTAQHREMLDQVLDLFKIRPDFDLDIMEAGQNLYVITQNILHEIENVLETFKPDLVLVHGDTTTTFSTALAAFYQKIDLGHVEAGLRTHNLSSPWPEEGNRRLTSVLTKLHFSPTKLSMKNLIAEGVDESIVSVTGNTVIDALNLILARIERDAKLKNKIKSRIIESGFSDFNSKFILVTGHRRENFGHGFMEICAALKTLALNNPEINILYPMHLNPNVREPVLELLSGIKNIKLVEPYQYDEFVYLMNKSYIIITDSGGIQEEAPSLGKPVLVTRHTTERPEAVLVGTVKLVGTSKEKIINEVQKLLDDPSKYDIMSKLNNPYGDGLASRKILDRIKDYFGIKN